MAYKLLTGVKSKLPAAKRRHKFGARAVSLHGYRFDSKAEAKRYLVLRVAEAGGIIQHLEVHPTFEVHPSFKLKSGRKIRPISYEADFSYQISVGDHRGTKVVEDVKGLQTAVYQIKRKLFLRLYDGKVEFVETPVRSRRKNRKR